MGGTAVSAARRRGHGAPRLGRSRLLLVVAVGVLVTTVVACRPLGGTTNRLGNDVAACPQFQPSALCGPQPNLWLGIQGPYELFANGDPFTTKCARTVSGPFNETTCSGAGRNPGYRTTGYGYAIDVGPDDVGRPLTVRVWDAGSYPRTGSSTRANASYTNATQLTLPSGSTWPGTGYWIYGEGIATGTLIQSLSNGNRTATLSKALTSTTATRSVAVASQSALPGESLYPIKRAIESAHVGLSLGLVGLIAIAIVNGQAFVYRQMDLGVRDGTYQMMFYGLTGTFVALMIAGLVFTFVTAFRFLGGRTRDREIVSAHAMFWYFIGAVYSILWFVVYVTK